MLRDIKRIKELYEEAKKMYKESFGKFDSPETAYFHLNVLEGERPDVAVELGTDTYLDIWRLSNEEMKILKLPKKYYVVYYRSDGFVEGYNLSDKELGEYLATNFLGLSKRAYKRFLKELGIEEIGKFRGNLAQSLMLGAIGLFAGLALSRFFKTGEISEIAQRPKIYRPPMPPEKPFPRVRPPFREIFKPLVMPYTFLLKRQHFYDYEEEEEEELTPRRRIRMVEPLL